MSRYRFPPCPVPLGRFGDGEGVRLAGYQASSFPIAPASPKGVWRREQEVG